MNPAKKEFKVNEYISLRLEKERTRIYINGNRFNQCMRLVLNIPVKEIQEYDEIDSIDEIADFYKSSDKLNENERILPEDEFWAHCSNIQAWVEHDYDTRLIHSSLSFPLLVKLAEVGDAKIKTIFKEEVAKRFLSGYFNVSSDF